MEISKITTRNIYEEITEQIKSQIDAGKLRPGDKLPSAKELSERYEVGRSTIREALSALKAMGYIDIRQGEGSTVREPSRNADDGSLPYLDARVIDTTTVMELMEARKALEVANAMIAASRRSSDDLQALRKLLDHMRQFLGDEEEGEKADLQFHKALAEATHNTIMMNLLDSISSPMERAIRETRRLQMYASKKVSQQLYEEHSAIYVAVASRDEAAAANAMREHLAHVEAVIRKFLPKK